MFQQLRVSYQIKRVSAPGELSIDRLQVLVQSGSIMASKWIARLTRSRLRGVSPHSLDCSRQGYTMMAYNYIVELVPFRLSRSHDHGLQVNISQLVRSWPLCVCPNGLDYGLQVATNMAPSASPNFVSPNLGVDLKVHSITASKCITISTQLPPPCASPKSLNHDVSV